MSVVVLDTDRFYNFASSFCLCAVTLTALTLIAITLIAVTVIAVTFTAVTLTAVTSCQTSYPNRLVEHSYCVRRIFLSLWVPLGRSGTFQNLFFVNFWSNIKK